MASMARIHTSTPLLSAMGVATVIGMMIGTWSVPLEARDADGERLGADLHEVDSTQSGELSPPDDVSDWSYFKIEDETRVTITLTNTSGNTSLALKLVDGTGDEMASRSVGNGDSVTVQETLNAGLYYVEVSSESDASYQLGIE